MKLILALAYLNLVFTLPGYSQENEQRSQRVRRILDAYPRPLHNINLGLELRDFEDFNEFLLKLNSKDKLDIQEEGVLQLENLLRNAKKELNLVKSKFDTAVLKGSCWGLLSFISGIGAASAFSEQMKNRNLGLAIGALALAFGYFSYNDFMTAGRYSNEGETVGLKIDQVQVAIIKLQALVDEQKRQVESRKQMLEN